MNNLNRFIEAQDKDYEIAKKELINGKKQSHWMWYIFPQIKGLGQSETSKYYSINDLSEAKEYLNHEILGNRLIELSKLLLDINTSNIIDIFGVIDSIKLRSSMTLFDYVSDIPIFNEVLEKYFEGKKDELTISICNNMREFSMFNLEYLKDEKEYNDLIKDVNKNFPKYRKALYNYYESNNEKFPFEGQSFCDYVLLVIFLNEYEYCKNIILKVLDNLFLGIDNSMSKVLILNFLCGFGVITKEEIDERNPYIELMEKNSNF